jgi:UDP:flavonoid glycosyltransferase YjiC (YdhE family)
MRRLLEAERNAVIGFAPDIIVHHPRSLASPHLAEALSCPHVLASPVPAVPPTAAFPSPLLPFASLGPLNRASHVLAVRGAEAAFAGAVRAWRQDALGLPARSRAAGRTAVTLYACSPQLVPVPSDWGADVHVTGAWFLDKPNWQPPEPLADFLAAGKPPVYVGFGSMPGRDAQRMTAIVAEALARTGQRGLLARGAGALGAATLPPHLHPLDEAPHDRLFPLVAAAVHHGGAGTTAAALRAGRPSVICPFFGDQPFWARRVAALGAAPAPLDPARLSADRLAAALAATEAESMRAAAERLGELIRREDGVAAAIRVIEAVVADEALSNEPA